MSDDEEHESTFRRVPPSVYADSHFNDKYAIERELGMGASGIVVCARHRELDERVAIKFLLAEQGDAAALARFRREARAANSVKNDHVVRIIDAATTQAGVPYVVMEYLEGVDLERMLLEVRDRQLPVRDAIEFVLQACEGLAECHGRGIVHRDLKPSNLFCTHGADGLPVIKLLDFGISKLSSTTVDAAMTGRHAIIGSPRYMSPEQFDAPADVDLRTDIWALGVLLYEILTGTVAFRGNTLIAIWESVKRHELQPLEELRRDAPPGLGAVVARCLQKDRADRFQNLAELARALLPFAPARSRGSVARIVRIVESPGVTTESLSLPPSGAPRSARRPSSDPTSVSVQIESRPSRRAWVMVLGLTAAAIVGLWLTRRGGSPVVEKAEQAATRAPSTATVAPAPALASAADAAKSTPPRQVASALQEPKAEVPGLSSSSPAPPKVSSRALAPASVKSLLLRQPVAIASVEEGPPLLPQAPSPTEPAASISAAPEPPASVASGTPAKPSSPFIVDVVEHRKPK